HAVRDRGSATATATTAAILMNGLGEDTVMFPFANAQWLRILPRKSLARSDFGLEKNSSGFASSTMAPSAMKTTRCEARRANPISWVTTTIVMPSDASDV